MTEKRQSASELDARQKWFENYCRELAANSIVHPQPGVRLRCPCCRCLTLDERGGYEICPVCLWEDDGQDEQDAQQVRGGPNGNLSLEQARINFATFGACKERAREHVRPATLEELGDPPP